MKTKIHSILWFLVGVVFGIVLITTDARAQQQPAPEPAKTSGYTVKSTIEVGVRGVSVEGNATKFRSDLNYDPGFRLFNSSLFMQSKNNDGMAFDTLTVNSFGWGGDPDGFLRVNAEKTKLYRLNVNYRKLDYFNNLSTIALNQHTSNTEYKLGDFDLTLLPQNERVRFNLGYSLERNKGESRTTYDYARDEFPILSPTRIKADDYRVGVDASLSILDISFQQGWRYYKEDTTYEITTPQVGNNPLNFSALNTFSRDLPTRGRSPYTRLSLHTNIKNRVDITGRFIYQSATARFELFERLTGKDASNNNILLDQFKATGDVKRPNTIGDLGVTVFATDKLRISETFRVHHFQITGGNQLSESLFRSRTTPSGAETPLPALFTDTLAFRDINYHRYVNTVELDYEFHPRFTAHFGHRYTDRHIEQHHQDFNLRQPPPEPEELETFDNRTNAFFFGFKARPVKMWTLYFDMEKGETDNVFTRLSNYNYTNFRVRSQLKPTRSLSLNMSVVTRDNSNPALTEGVPPREFGVDVNSRVFTGSVDWSKGEKFWLSSGYTHTHLTSEAAIILFLNGVRTEGLSRYFMKDNYAFLNMQAQPHRRVGVYASYSIHHDPGQQDRVADLTAPNLTDLFITSFPYQYQAPEVRVSVRITDRLDWIAGYQYFDYKEKFVNAQYYQAHLPYTSLRFYFGGKKD